MACIETTARNKNIIRAYSDGASVHELALMYGVSDGSIYQITRAYRKEHGAPAPNKEKEKEDRDLKSDQKAREESQYLEVLYSYVECITAINEYAMDGMTIKNIQKKVEKTRNAFNILTGSKGERKLTETKKPEEDQHKQTVKSVNKMICYNGWLRCPRCGKKLHKVTKQTKLVEFPLWCKMCHKTTLINM